MRRLIVAALAALVVPLAATTEGWPAGWRTAETLSFPFHDVSDLASGVTPNGTVVVAWTESSATVNYLKVATREPGSVWSPATLIEIPRDQGGAAAPQVRVTAPDGASVFTRRIDIVGNTHTFAVLEFSMNQSSRGWTQRTITPDPEGGPVAAILAKEGGAVAAVPKGLGLAVYERTVTGPWLPVTTFSAAYLDPSHTSSRTRDPHLAVGADGTVGLVWRSFSEDLPLDESQRPPSPVVRAALRRHGGGWQPSVIVSQLAGLPFATELGPPGPQVAVDDAGRIAVTFGFGSMLTSAGWTPLLDYGVKPTRHGLTALTDGSLLAVWSREGAPLSAHLDAQASDWTVPKPIATAPNTLAYPLGVAAGPGGTARALWIRSQGSTDALFESMYDAGAWAPMSPVPLPRLQNTLPTGQMLGLDAEGNGAAASIAPNGAQHPEALVTLLDATPPELTALTVPATVSTDSPATMSLTATDGWGGTVQAPVWTFGDGTPSAKGTTVTHAYTTSGTYLVSVTVADDAANSATHTRQVVVASPAPVPPSPPQGTGSTSPASVPQPAAGDVAALPNPTSATARALITTGVASVTRAGNVTLDIACQANGPDCTGRVELRAALPAPRSTAARKALVIGHARIEMRAGEMDAVTVRLNKRARSAVRQRGELRATAVVTLRAGNTTSRTRRVVRLRGD